jgi:hypothetical protein
MIEKKKRFWGLSDDEFTAMTGKTGYFQITIMMLIGIKQTF